MAVDTFIAATGGDGFVRRYSGGSFSAVRSASSGDDAGGSSTADWGAYAEPSTPMIYRAFLPFDTSGLPDADFITAASIWVYSYGSPATGGGGSTANKSVAVVASTQASNTALATSDYPQVGTTELATRVAASSFPNGGWVEIPLNAAGIAAINATGYSKFALRIGYDLDNVAPSATGCGVLLRWADYASTTYDPYLSVTHSATQAVGTSWETPYSVGGDDVFMASAGTSDGEVRGLSNTSWATLRALTTGSSVDNSSTTAWGAYVGNNAGDPQTYANARGFLSFDTSSLSDSDTTISGALWVWVNTKWDTGVSGTPRLCLVAASQSSPLATADFDAIGSTELASRVTLSGVSNGSWVKFTLNSAGLAAVSRSGTSKFAILMSHDLDGDTPDNTKYAGVNISYGEDAAAKRPRLIVNNGAAVGASLEQPYGISGTVGLSWATPYYLDSPRVMARLEQPYLVYNFKSGGRTLGTAHTVVAAGTAGTATGWNCIPTLVKVPDPTTPFGKLQLRWAQNMGQIVHPVASFPDNGHRIKESVDLGSTWGTDWRIDVDQPPDYVNGGGRIRRDPVTGDLVMMWYQPPGGSGIYPPLGDSSFFSRSSDQGDTWTTPLLLDPYSGFASRSSTTVTAAAWLLPLRNGKWLISVYGSDGTGADYGQVADATNAIYTRVMESTDQGATWTPKSIMFPKGTNPDGRVNPYEILWAEAAMVELDTGRILAVARVQNFLGATYNTYWSCYSDDGGSTWSSPAYAMPSITNMVCLTQTVAGDVLCAGSDYSGTPGTKIYQSKDRGASWSLLGSYAITGGMVGGDFIEVLDKDAENNLLFAFGAESWGTYDYGSPYGVDTIANQGTVNFLALGSAVSDPPEVIAGSIGHTWDLPYGMSAPVGRSWTQPYSINATAERTANGGWAWSDGVARQVTYLRLTVEHPTSGANSEYWVWHDSVASVRGRVASDSWDWSDSAVRPALSLSRGVADTWTWGGGASGSVGPVADSWAWADIAIVTTSITGAAGRSGFSITSVLGAEVSLDGVVDASLTFTAVV